MRVDSTTPRAGRRRRDIRKEHSVPYQLLVMLVVAALVAPAGSVACSDLYIAQMCCAEPTIDRETQQPTTCRPDHTATVPCFAREGVVCDGVTHTSAATAGTNASESLVLCDGRYYRLADAVGNKTFSCAYSDPENPYYWDTALVLSVFLGMIGADRFYLGYPAIGLLKLSTLGFFFIGQAIDVVLIALQIVGPADGTAYRTNYYTFRAAPDSLPLGGSYDVGEVQDCH